MAKTKKSAQDKQLSPLFNRQGIQNKLEQVLADLKPAFGEKKFRRRIKKAGKLISNGLPKKQKAAKPEAESIAAETA